MASLLISLLAVTLVSIVVDKRNIIENLLNSTLPLYSDSDVVQSFWDNLQNNLGCCGVNSDNSSLSFGATRNASKSLLLCLEATTDIFEEDCTSTLHKLLTDEKLNPILCISAASMGGLL